MNVAERVETQFFPGETIDREFDFAGWSCIQNKEKLVCGDKKRAVKLDRDNIEILKFEK